MRWRICPTIVFPLCEGAWMRGAGTSAAPKIDTVNTFEAPATVVPKPVSVKASRGKLVLTLAPASVSVLELN
jgi:alpha-L-arabinofuranosidase